MKYIILLLSLAGCCAQNLPEASKPLYSFGDKVQVEGFYATCNARVVGYDQRSSYKILIDCPGYPDFESWYKIEHIKLKNK